MFLLLKNRLKKDDFVVCIFHDHGSRYVGKIYNDQWMMERGFLEVKTCKDIINGRAHKKLVTISPQQTVADAVALMEKYDIEHIPVMDDNQIKGAVSEGGLFIKMFSNPEIKSQMVETVTEPSYPIVDIATPIEKLGALINKTNGAVLVNDEKGDYHIITKYDILQSLGR